MAAGGKATTEESVRRLIGDIRDAAKRFRSAAAGMQLNDSELCSLVHEAKVALAPLIGKRRMSAKDRDCIRRWQRILVGLLEALEKIRE